MTDERGVANETNTMLVRWILGIGASILVLFVATSIARFDAHDHRINSNEIAIGKLTEKMSELIDIAKSARADQLDRMAKFGEIDTKLALLDMRMTVMLDRFDALKEKKLVP